MHGSVSCWLELCKSGDRHSSQHLWERFHRRIVGLAKRCLVRSGHRYQDEEDVAQETFNSFFMKLQRGCYPELLSRSELWKLLVVITKHKAIDHVRRTQRGAIEIGANASRDLDIQELQEIPDGDALHEKNSEFRDEFYKLFDLLEEDLLKQLVRLKLDGLNNSQIATELGCCRRTVIRKLERIRKIWSTAYVTQ